MMNIKYVYLCVGFVAGAIVGVIATKDYFQKDADTRVEDFKAAYKNHVIKKSQHEEEEKKEYEDMTGHYKSSSEEPVKPVVRQNEEENEDVPVIEYVSPYEFGEKGGYDMLSYTYYEADGNVADSNDDLVRSPEDILGDFKSHFGEYEDDSVFVRNHELKADIEILKDVRTYQEAMDIIAHS